MGDGLSSRVKTKAIPMGQQIEPQRETLVRTKSKVPHKFLDLMFLGLIFGKASFQN